MPGRAAVLVVVATVAGAALLAGCRHDPTDETRPRPASTPAPALGGPVPERHRAPRSAMDDLERPVAHQLARQIAADGLTLGHLDCPHWDGTVPSTMSCRGYVDELLVDVWVQLSAPHGDVSFDARVSGGVVATRRIERTLRRDGWTAADCGEVAAYPAQAGVRIVCRVERAGRRSYVVATVRSRAGAVTIAEYARSGAGP